MTFNEMLVRISSEAQVLLWPMYLVIAVTALVFIVLKRNSRHVWPNRANFGWLGMFYCLSGYGVIRMASVWVKFLLMCIFLFSFQVLTVQHYFMIFLMIIIYCIDPKEKLTIITRFIGEIPQLIVLFIVNIIYSYINNTSAGTVFWILYIFLSIFIAIYSYYLFMNELRTISASRRASNGYTIEK